MPPKQPVYVDPEWFDWMKVGPPDDPGAHLMAQLIFGNTPMVLHAVEAVMDANGRMKAKAFVCQFILWAIEDIMAWETPLRTQEIDGRQYVLAAVPNINGGRLA